MRNLHTNLNIAMIKHNNSSGIADVFMQWFPRYICILYMNAQLIGCYVYVIQYKRPHQRYMNRSIRINNLSFNSFCTIEFSQRIFRVNSKKKNPSITCHAISIPVLYPCFKTRSYKTPFRHSWSYISYSKS